MGEIRGTTRCPLTMSRRGWGRVLVCGRVAADEAGHDIVGAGECLAAPHVLRSMCHIRVREVLTSCVADHAVFLSVEGDAYVYGRNREGQCGVSGSGWLYHARRLDRERDFEPPLAADDVIVTGATGATHTLLVTAQGAVYAAGSHEHGECGMHTRETPFQRVDMPFGVVHAACGRAWSLVVTREGHVYGMGSCESGVLGDGMYRHTGPSRLVYDCVWQPMRIAPLVNIARVSCGESHAAALDHEGCVYVWGTASLSRLGCGTQMDQGSPVRIPQFVRKQQRVRSVVCGRTSTWCVDQAHRLWAAGTWRAKGDGGPNQSFLIYKPLQELADYDVHCVAAGADTFQCLASSRVWAWGEQAWHAELGAHTAPPVPAELDMVRGLRVVGLASGRHTSYWLVEPDDDGAYADLVRYPPTVPESSSVCMVCRQSNEDDDATLLECDRCENPYHLSCLSPPLDEVPQGEWFCEACVDRKKRRLS